VDTLHISAEQECGAGPGDYVAFKITSGRIGRKHDNVVTGPDGQGIDDSSHALIFKMADIPDLG